MSRSIWMALVPMVVVACGKDGDSGSTTDNLDETSMPYCEDAAAPMLASETAITGVLGADFLARLVPELAGEVAFADGTSGAVQVRVVVDEASLRSVESVEVYPDNGGASPAIAVICPDRIEVDAVVSISSEDGRLDESLAVVLALSDGSDSWDGGAPVPSFSLAVGPTELGGTLDLSGFADISRYDEVELHWMGTLDISGFDAAFSGQGSAVQGDTAFAEMFEIATMTAIPPVE